MLLCVLQQKRLLLCAHRSFPTRSHNHVIVPTKRRESEAWVCSLCYATGDRKSSVVPFFTLSLLIACVQKLVELELSKDELEIEIQSFLCSHKHLNWIKIIANSWSLQTSFTRWWPLHQRTEVTFNNKWSQTNLDWRHRITDHQEIKFPIIRLDNLNLESLVHFH